MRHNMSGRKFSRDTTARKALLRGLAMNLIEYGQITTTLAKAKDLRGVIEPLITKARTGTLAARRNVAQTVTNPLLVQKLFAEVAPKFAGVNGGYTRVIKTGFRKGDQAPTAIIELTK